MLVTSTSVSPSHSVIISRTKLILGFGIAVKSIPFGTIFSRVDTKSISDNDFLSDLANRLNFFFELTTRDLFFLPCYAKSSLSKFKSFLLGSIYFLHGSHLFAELMHDGFVKPVRTAASTPNIATAT